MSPLWVAAAWAPVAFFLHCALHELSHAAVAQRLGGVVERICLWPGFREGRFTWAYVHLKISDVTGLQLVPFALAPMVAEFVWGIAVVFVCSLAQPMPSWLFAIALVEALAVLCDVVVWALGMWRATPATDGWMVRSFTEMGGTEAGLYGAALVVSAAMLVACVVLLWVR